MAEQLHVHKVAKFGRQGENLNLFYKDLAAQFDACSFDKMQFQDLLTYTLFFHIVEVDLKEEVVKLWKSKEELGQHLLPTDVLAVIVMARRKESSVRQSPSSCAGAQGILSQHPKKH